MKRKFLYLPLTFIVLSGLFVSNSCANNKIPVLEYKLNQSIDYSGIKWTVSGVKDFGSKLTSEDIKEFNATIDDTLAKGRFIYVEFWIVNSSGKVIASPYNPVIIDEKNVEYKVTYDFLKNWQDKSYSLEFVVGGPELGMPLNIESRTVPYHRAVFFDVPIDAKELKLKIPDLMNENSKIVLVNLIDFKEDFAFMGKLVSVEEASDLMGTRIPLPSCLPEGYAVQEIYIGFSNRTTIILISDRPIEKIDREPPDIPKDYPIHLVKCPIAMYVSFSQDLRITGGNTKPSIIPIEFHKMSDGNTLSYRGMEIDGRIASLMLNSKPEIGDEDILKISLSMK